MKNKIPKFLGIHAEPSKWLGIILLILPFVILISIYVGTSEYRHAKNPADKLTPTIGNMYKTTGKLIYSVSRRTGEAESLILKDTLSSLKRIGLGLALSAVFGFILGINMGLLPGVRQLLLPFVTFVSNIPPLAILPILFIILGQGDFAKIMLIFLGTFTPIARDICYHVQKIPQENIVKALTLGASQFGVAYRVVIKQAMPRLIEDVRLQLGSAWLFLIASEAISAESGLGYRIFLVIRYLSMNKIIPYVMWITIIAFTFDCTLKNYTQWKYPWYDTKIKKAGYAVVIQRIYVFIILRLGTLGRRKGGAA